MVPMRMNSLRAEVSAHAEAGLVQDAQSTANEFLAAHPGANEVYDALAKYYKENNQSDLAIEMLRRKVDANPQNTSAIFDLASTYRAAGRNATWNERSMRSGALLNDSRMGMTCWPTFMRAPVITAMPRKPCAQGRHGSRSARSTIRLKKASCWFDNGVRKKPISSFEALAPSSLSTEQHIARQALLAQLDFPDGTEIDFRTEDSCECRATRTSSPSCAGSGPSETG